MTIILKSEKLSRNQRRALADAYAARGRKGLAKTVAGWIDETVGGIEYHSAGTIHSLFRRGYLEFYAKDTVAHVNDRGADLHERLCAVEVVAARKRA
jgi:hypothetical protein